MSNWLWLAQSVLLTSPTNGMLLFQPPLEKGLRCVQSRNLPLLRCGGSFSGCGTQLSPKAPRYCRPPRAQRGTSRITSQRQAVYWRDRERVVDVPGRFRENVKCAHTYKEQFECTSKTPPARRMLQSPSQDTSLAAYIWPRP